MRAGSASSTNAAAMNQVADHELSTSTILPKVGGNRTPPAKAKTRTTAVACPTALGLTLSDAAAIQTPFQPTEQKPSAKRRTQRPGLPPAGGTSTSATAEPTAASCRARMREWRRSESQPHERRPERGACEQHCDSEAGGRLRPLDVVNQIDGQQAQQAYLRAGHHEAVRSKPCE